MEDKRFFVIFFRGLALLLWMGVIFLFSSMPGSGVMEEPSFAYYLERKGAHVIEYLVLMLLAIRCAISLFPGELFSRILMLSGVFSLAYAVTDELHQFFIPFRGAKMSDVGFDFLGIILMGMLMKLACDPARSRPRRTSEPSLGKRCACRERLRSLR